MDLDAEEEDKEEVAAGSVDPITGLDIDTSAGKGKTPAKKGGDAEGEESADDAEEIDGDDDGDEIIGSDAEEGAETSGSEWLPEDD